MRDEDKDRAKSFLISEADNYSSSGLSPASSPTLNSSILHPTHNSSALSKVSNQAKLKMFREQCGIAAVSKSTINKGLNNIKQEIALFESIEKNDTNTFSTFWKQHSSSLPTLVSMARRYGPLPATSVPSESSFSVAGYLARKSRSSLSPKSLKYCMFLKDKM